MSATVVKTRETPHSDSLSLSWTDSTSLPEPAGRAGGGDRFCLMFWLSCAGILIALHIGQHLVYLLR